MAVTAQFADTIAFDPQMGYYDPVTMYTVDEDRALALVSQAHREHLAVDGVDNAGTETPSLEITPAVNQANLDRAAAQARDDLRLSGDRSTWTQQEAVDYIRRLQSVITANSAFFTPETVNVARNLHVQSDLSADAGRKLIDPNAILVSVTDLISPTVDMFTPLARIPTTVANASNAAVNAANSLISAVDKMAKALDNSSGLATFAVPLAFGVFLWYAARSTGRDPGGQLGKVIA